MSDDGVERLEIERKFLVSEPPVSRQQPTTIHQGYITVGSDGTEVRLRRKGDRFFQTIKRGSGLSRREAEVELTQTQFDTLWPQTEGRRVVKDRYEIPYRGRVIELDVFHGKLEGLIIAEVEFDSEKECESFTPPDWFGDDVTENPEYKNRSLALEGRPGLTD
ncbi:MAG: CYTH domain-containing protein [Candidatus Latescibacterota bacterium]|nr:MAG: CYTH domain-containing protein [Candidatus Latescibacterota bacterium]